MRATMEGKTIALAVIALVVIYTMRKKESEAQVQMPKKALYSPVYEPIIGPNGELHSPPNPPIFSPGGAPTWYAEPELGPPKWGM